ncbi:Uncharacterised protein [Streptococcus pneumoniae]|nr:Uncharacterised protein [Streptococcus pneumoniae]
MDRTFYKFIYNCCIVIFFTFRNAACDWYVVLLFIIILRHKIQCDWFCICYICYLFIIEVNTICTAHSFTKRCTTNRHLCQFLTIYLELHLFYLCKLRQRPSYRFNDLTLFFFRIVFHFFREINNCRSVLFQI